MQFLGVVTVIVDGRVIATMEGVNIETGGFSREPVKANGRTAGFTSKVETPMVSCKAAVDADFDFEIINAMSKGTVVASGDNGFAVQLDGAWTSKPVKVGDNGGGAELEFQGETLRKLKI